MTNRNNNTRPSKEAAKHSPLPWKVYESEEQNTINHAIFCPDPQEDWIAQSIYKYANAEFIVRACNSHYQNQETIDRLIAEKLVLVEALQEALFYLEDISDSENWINEVRNKMQQALALAGEK